jgi:hypothetical protein
MPGGSGSLVAASSIGSGTAADCDALGVLIAWHALSVTTPARPMIRRITANTTWPLIRFIGGGEAPPRAA